MRAAPSRPAAAAGAPEAGMTGDNPARMPPIPAERMPPIPAERMPPIPAERMPPIPAERMTGAQRAAVAEIVAGARGALYGPFIPLLRSPDFMGRLQKTGEYLRFGSVLPKRTSEFIILMVARHYTQQFEWAVHQPIALEAGVGPETAQAIAEGR